MYEIITDEPTGTAVQVTPGPETSATISEGETAMTENTAYALHRTEI